MLTLAHDVAFYGDGLQTCWRTFKVTEMGCLATVTGLSLQVVLEPSCKTKCFAQKSLLGQCAYQWWFLFCHRSRKIYPVMNRFGKEPQRINEDGNLSIRPNGQHAMDTYVIESTWKLLTVVMHRVVQP